MRSVRLLALAISVILPASAVAQDEDFLAPLVDEPKKPAKKKKPKPVKKAPKAETPADDDLLPIESLVASKTELLVKVATGIKGAEVLVDGKSLGQITGAPVEVSPGEHTVIVRRPGFAEFSKKVAVGASKLTEVFASLEPVAGVLAVNVDPDDAEVLVDGKSVGTGDLKDIPLIPGNRAVTVRRAGMAEQRHPLSVKAGKDYPLDVTLVPAPETRTIVAQNADTDRPEQPRLTPELAEADASVDTGAEAEVEGATPMYKRWYVWAGIGALVAGAAAGAYVASANSATAGGGGLQPAQVCAPNDCDATLNWPGIRFR